MRKLLLMSILIATFWLPIAAAREPYTALNLRKVRKRFAVFCVAYVIAIVYVLPRM